MSDARVLTNPDTGEKFTVDPQGRLVPHTEQSEVLVGTPIAVESPVNEVVDLTAPVANLRGNNAEHLAIDDAGFVSTGKIDAANTPLTEAFEPSTVIEPDTTGIVVDIKEVHKPSDAPLGGNIAYAQELKEQMQVTDNPKAVEVDVKPTTEHAPAPTEVATQNSDKVSYATINATNLSNIRYKLTQPVSIKLTDAHPNFKSAPIHIPMATQNELDLITQNLPTLSDDVARTLNPEWVGAYYNCIEESSTTDSFVESMKIPGSVWTQRIEHLGETIGPKRAAIGDVREHKLTGAAAIFHMQNLLSAGTSVTYPLWASGLWVTLRNPTDSELSLLEETIKREKISVGRRTLGIAFNNQTVFLVKHVFNFIKDHIYETNIKDISTAENKDIGDYIKITDLFPLIHLTACTIYPEGYPYKSPCLNTAPANCGGVVSEVLQLFKMFWNKESSITPEMRQYMSNANHKHTVKEVLAYQKSFAENCSEIIDDINDGFKVVARIPTVNEYIESGERWINEMVTTIESKLGNDLSDIERNHLINDQARLTRMREFVHCFDKVIFTANEQVVEKRADIEAVFNVMSGTDDIVDKLSTSLSSFISRHTLTVIGIPNYVCPDCEKQHNPDISLEHSLFTPIDPLNLFFTLKDRKIYRQ